MGCPSPGAATGCCSSARIRSLNRAGTRKRQAFIERADRGRNGGRVAAAFRLRYEAFGLSARVAEWLAAIRSQLLGMPYGNQGLLISKAFYQRIGGHRHLPEMEDLDIAMRIGRGRMVFLRAGAVSSGSAEPQGFVTAIRKSIARLLRRRPARSGKARGEAARVGAKGRFNPLTA